MAIFSVEDLAQHAGVSTQTLEELAESLPSGAGTLYSRLTFPKKRGGFREVVSPRKTLDVVTKNLHRSFLDVFRYRPPEHVHGFVKGRSTISNASEHLGRTCVLRVDLKSFFPSIDSTRLKAAFLERVYDEKAAELCVRVVTISDKLPVGVSTSPFLSNLVFRATDYALLDYARAEGLGLTRYVDDLSFSGEVEDRHLSDITRILEDLGWRVNTRKTAFMRRGGPQYVTGLYVGAPDRPRIPRKTKRRMRWILHVISRFGYETYMTEFGGLEAGMIPQRLLGWSCYVASVEPDVGFPLFRAFREILPESYTPPSYYAGEIAGIRIIHELDDLR